MANWKDGTTAFRNHEKAASHYEAFQVTITLPSTTLDIGGQLSQQHATHKFKSRQALYQIISSIKFLGRQIRGDGTEDSNLHRLLKMKAEEDSNLLEWLKRKEIFTQAPTSKTKSLN